MVLWPQETASPTRSWSKVVNSSSASQRSEHTGTSSLLSYSSRQVRPALSTRSKGGSAQTGRSYDLHIPDGKHTLKTEQVNTCVVLMHSQ